jgi:hypothetical protein
MERLRWYMRRFVLVLGGLVTFLALGLWACWYIPRGDQKPEPGRSPVTPPAITGRIVAPEGPLAGVCVRFQGTGRSTTTDEAGRFRLSSSASAQRVTAWKEGYFIAGAPLKTFPRELQLHPLPEKDNPAYEWVSPDPGPGERRCGNCHAEIYREWQSSGHARSATGRRFRSLYEGSDWEGKEGVGWGLLTEYADGAGVCAACHAPALPEVSQAFFDLRQVSGVARHGVHCDYCHKIAEVGAGTVGLTHGRYGQRLLRPAEGKQVFLGPLDDVDRGEDTYAPLYGQSRYCASCHEGILFGVPVYRTYSEWLDSPARRAGKQCQDCHMAATGRLTNIAPGHGGIERDPVTLGNHRFFAGSQEAMLQRCLHLSTEVQKQGEGYLVSVVVQVGDVGHRLPTGFIDRHLLLVVEGQTQEGERLPATGPVLPGAAGKGLAGRPGKFYGRLLGDEKGQSPVPFWRASQEVDTRLSPGAREEVNWHFRGGSKGLARVRVRLIYRRFYEEVAHRKGWPEDEIVVERRELVVSR